MRIVGRALATLSSTFAAVALVALALVLGHANLPPHGNSASAQDLEPVAVVQQFWEAVDRGDSAGAVALFSDTGTFQGTYYCRNTCTDRSDIQMAIADGWVPYAPYTPAIEQACGDTVAVRGQGEADRA